MYKDFINKKVFITTSYCQFSLTLESEADDYITLKNNNGDIININKNQIISISTIAIHK